MFVWVKCTPDSQDVAPGKRKYLPFFIQEAATVSLRSGRLDSARKDLSATYLVVTASKKCYYQ